MSTSSSTPKQGRIAQILQTYQLTRRSDPKLPWILIGVAIVIPLVIIAIVVLGFKVTGWAVAYWVVTSILLGLLAATFIFGRRAEKAAYAQIEGQPGAAAAVLGSLRSGWFSTPAVAVTRNQDLVHRVVGKPGIVLVSEGPPSRAATLLAAERKKSARWAPDVPIHEIQSGDEPGQVPLRKLNTTVTKLPRALTAAEVTTLRKRLEAVSTASLPIPKGPMPKSGKIPKNMRG